jgi:hypothetical protein
MIAAFALALSLTACPLEKAHYTLRGRPDVTADFRLIPRSANWPSGIALRIRTGAAPHWFLPYGGNGQGITTHLASTENLDGRAWAPPDPDTIAHRPLGDLNYLGANAGYDFDQGFHFAPGVPAAAHLFLPRLQEAFWYRAQPHQGLPMAFFDLTGCD